MLLHLGEVVLVAGCLGNELVLVLGHQSAQNDLEYSQKDQIVLDSLRTGDRLHHVADELLLGFQILNEIRAHQLGHKIVKLLHIFRQMDELEESLNEQLEVHVDGHRQVLLLNWL